MKDYLELLDKLCSCMSVSGHEYYSKNMLHQCLDGYFDEHFEDSVGNNVFIKRCGKENAKKLLLDSHYDEIGMIVSGICEGGFLSVVNVGGIDTGVLASGEVTVYGKEEIYGVIVAKPPHLQNEQDLKKLPKITELYIDTGYSKEYLEEIVEVGTPIGFRTYNTSLVSGRYVGKSFDDKSCVAAAVEAVRKTKREDMEYDVYLLLSAQEESARKGGAMVAAYGIYPDVAIVLDVNLASFPGVNEYETVKLGKGPSVSLSAVTDRKLTNKIIDTAKKNNIDCQSIVEISSTGTNADLMGLTGNGIPVAVVSIPLRNMHTQSEVIDLEDVKNTVKLLQAIITEKECEN